LWRGLWDESWIWRSLPDAARSHSSGRRSGQQTSGIAAGSHVGGAHAGCFFQPVGFGIVGGSRSAVSGQHAVSPVAARDSLLHTHQSLSELGPPHQGPADSSALLPVCWSFPGATTRWRANAAVAVFWPGHTSVAGVLCGGSAGLNYFQFTHRICGARIDALCFIPLLLLRGG